MAGRLLFQQGRREEAEVFLRRARDLDQLRFRANSALKAIIEEQWQELDPPFLSVDAVKPLVADSPNGSLGFPHFYEHVHFSFRANFLIAQAFAIELLELEHLDTQSVDDLDWSQAASGLGYTTYDAWLILEEIERRFSEPPFTDIPEYARFTICLDTGHLSQAEEALGRIEAIFPEHPNLESFRKRLSNGSPNNP